MREQVV